MAATAERKAEDAARGVYHGISPLLHPIAGGQRAHASSRLARGQPETLPAGKEIWVHCCNQWGTCLCPGTVRWGTERSWKEYQPEVAGGTLELKCSVENLPDVAPGDDSKRCECKVSRPEAVG